MHVIMCPVHTWTEPSREKACHECEAVFSRFLSISLRVPMNKKRFKFE